jgi:hypothetical protein
MRMRSWIVAAALAMAGAGVALVPPALAQSVAAVSLSASQDAALQSYIASSATSAPAATRLPFSIAAQNLSGSLIFGEIEDRGGVLRKQCRGVIVEFVTPSRGALQSQACINRVSGAVASNWTVDPFSRAASAADTAKVEPAKPSPPPPAVATGPAPGSAPPPARTGATRSIGGAFGGITGGLSGSGGASTGSGSAPIAAPGVGGGLTRVLSPVLVELAAGEPRTPRNGGSAVVLLSENVADRDLNLSLCRALFRNFDTATTGEVLTGERRNDRGEIEQLRPLYWLLKDQSAATGDKCVSRVARFDFERAWKIRSKFVLNGRGPYLLIARADERRAGLVDLSGANTADVADLVRYFRDGFSQQGDVWTKDTPPAESQANLTAYLGRAVRLLDMPKLILVSTVRAGCPLGNFLDVCTNPLPR